ncbi:hypothetical protein EYF80_067442 [Liparis tanakae]|uniref:Uncharacterized protein n=1 Tax=Liparis tanakae TaxID=230148 RepID=A0A4Z2E141_9TELE|nr:hypothetical protein EYF80_067442 [Liparis tanakae]
MKGESSRESQQICPLNDEVIARLADGLGAQKPRPDRRAPPWGNACVTEKLIGFRPPASLCSTDVRLTKETKKKRPAAPTRAGSRARRQEASERKVLAGGEREDGGMEGSKDGGMEGWMDGGMEG